MGSRSTPDPFGSPNPTPRELWLLVAGCPIQVGPDRSQRSVLSRVSPATGYASNSATSGAGIAHVG